MSQGKPLSWSEAHAAAIELVGVLADACERIEIAGSIRRRKGEVHDIELVAIPRIEMELVTDLLFAEEQPVNRLPDRIFAARPELAPRDVEVHRADGSIELSKRMGESYMALAWRGIPVDLFITDAERWGAIFALRTGPHDWNIRLVQDCKDHFRRVDAGRVLHFETVIPTPEEADFFRALGVPWVEPQDRRPDRLRFDRQLLAEIEA